MSKPNEQSVTDDLLFKPLEEDEIKQQRHANLDDDESSSEIYRDMFTSKDIDMKTDLSPNMILALAKGTVFADRFNVQVVKDLQLSIMRLMVSKDRKGRTEILEIYSAEKKQFELDPLIPQHMLGRL